MERPIKLVDKAKQSLPIDIVFRDALLTLNRQKRRCKQRGFFSFRCVSSTTSHSKSFLIRRWKKKGTKIMAPIDTLIRLFTPVFCVALVFLQTSNTFTRPSWPCHLSSNHPSLRRPTYKLCYP